MNNGTTDFNFSPAKLDEIYLKLSVSTGDYQKENKDKNLLDIINECFNDKLKHIDNSKLIKDENLINGSFVKFYLDCKKCGYIDISNVFIFYCDFFDIDYNTTYTKLYKKIQDKIEDYFIYKIGGYEAYDKLKAKYGVQKNKTLFDLIK